MREVVGDLFDFVGTHWVVVTTNEGWKLNGDNVMGAGVARLAVDICPELPKLYGMFCRDNPGSGRIAHYEVPDSEGNWRGFIMLPTKALNPAAPHMSWKSRSSLPLIERGLEQLAAFGETSERNIALPLPGTANGGLSPDDVLPIVRKHLADDKFVLVMRMQW